MTCLALALCLTLFWSAPAEAQVSGATMSGLITDPSGAGIPNASVSIKNTGTGEVREVPTNGDGFYSAPEPVAGELRGHDNGRRFQQSRAEGNYPDRRRTTGAQSQPEGRTSQPDRRGDGRATGSADGYLIDQLDCGFQNRPGAAPEWSRLGIARNSRGGGHRGPQSSAGLVQCQQRKPWVWQPIDRFRPSPE